MTATAPSASVSANSETLDKKIISVRELLADQALAIPQYQRPYKWTSKNINQLFSDISVHSDKSAYRLGTIVFHHEFRQEGGKKIIVKNIVDGQQRTITLMLTVRALLKLLKDEEKALERKDLEKQLIELKENTINLNPSFSSEISKANIHNNFLEISRIVSRSDFTEAYIDFLLNKCQVVTFSLSNVSEAFQFFDSQNARGRDLDPHDLLKAYHLREFSASDKHLMASTVSNWENSNAEELASLFAQHLYRIRSWAKGESARYFGKDDTSLFKGVNIDTVSNYPYVEQLRIAHHFVDEYNRQYERRIDGRSLGFPFHLDQIIINGRRFFEMTNHYQAKVARICEESNLVHKYAGIENLDGYAGKIIKTINNYPARKRTGDEYVRLMFDCLLIYYIDKFGHAEISRAIEKIFIWAYSLRLSMQVVQLATMDNYVLENNLFRLIKDATRPVELVNVSLPVIEQANAKGTNMNEVKDLFREMKFYEGVEVL